jgi:hypothetical protein
MKTFSVQSGLAGPPSACSCAPDRIDVFAVVGDGRVWRWPLIGSTWLAPAPLAANGSFPHEGVCAISSAPGRVEVFAIDQGSRTPRWWRGDGAAFTVGQNLGGPAIPAVPVAAVAASPSDIDVFAVDAKGLVQWWHWNGTNWTGPEPLAGGPTLSAERIAAVSPSPGQLDVFAVGPDRHLWHWRKTAAMPWGIQDLGGDLPSEGVSAVSWGPGRIDVFAAPREPDNGMQHWWQQGTSVFSAPESLGGSLVTGSVSAVSHAPDRLDVFAVTADQRIAQWQWNGRSWSGPDLRGSSIPAGDLSAVVRKPHRLDVFGVGAGNTLRKWPGGGVENSTNQPWTNWPTNHTKNAPPGVLRPDNIEELANIIQEAELAGQGVRAVGSSWSNSDTAVSPGYVVETDELNAVLTNVLSTSLNAVGSGMRLVHVEAGIKLFALNDLLDARDLALKTLGGSTGQSLAGAVSTSVHGMDIDLEPLPDMVRAIHLVGPGGVQHWIEPGSRPITEREALTATLELADENVHYDDDWFYSVLVSMGSLGIIYSLVVEVEPQYDLIQTRVAVGWKDMKEKLSVNGTAGDPFAGNRGVQVVLDPFPAGDGSRTCYLTTRTRGPATGPYRPHTVDPDPKFLAPGLLAGFRVNSSSIDNMVNLATSRNQSAGSYQGWAHTLSGGGDAGAVKGLTVEALFDANSTTYLEFLDAALEIIRAAYYVEQPPQAYLGWISVRFQGPSQAYLSPQHRFRRTCSIEFAAAWREPPLPGVGWADTPVLLSRIEAEAKEPKYGGIQHWGLNNALDGSDVARAYPMLNLWRSVRWQLTKGGTLKTFDSDFTRRCGLSDPPHFVRCADFGSDGKTDFAVWRPSTGTWMVMDDAVLTRPLNPDVRISVAAGERLQRVVSRHNQQWGQVGDIPVPGRYDSDNQTDFAVWRPSTGTWWVFDSATGAQRSQQWGQAGDVPVPGDYDGDGKTDFAVWRPSTGTWFVIDSATGAQRSQQWGQAGDIPVQGRYGSNNKTDFAVWRPSTGTWWIFDSETGAQRSQQWGLPDDLPVPGDYDGDGKTDFAVWRPSTGTWWIIDSSSGAQRSQQWGQFGDIPV